MVKECTRQRNRIRSFLNEYCVRLPKGTRLTTQEAEVPRMDILTEELLSERFDCLQQSEKRRKHLKRLIKELLDRPQWCSFNMMGVRHIVAFGLMAIIGDVNRFP